MTHRTITYDDKTHKLMPIIPEKAMIDFAFNEGFYEGHQAEYLELENIYASMIKAAPDHSEDKLGELKK